MSRKELYNKVKELGIAKEVEKKFHQNYTRVSNADLESFIQGFGIKKKTAPKREAVNNCNTAMVKLVSTLQAKKYITAAEANDVLRML